MNWYIGQPVVAVRTHSEGVVKKGQEFTIIGLQKPHCKCKDNVFIDVGVRECMDGYDEEECPSCGHISAPNSTYWFSETLFAPLDQDISELTEVLNSKQPFEL